MAATPTSPNASLQTAEAVATATQTDLVRGLSAQEAARRLAQDGPNQLHTKPPPPAWRRLLKQFQDPLIYLLMAAVVVTLLAWFIEGRVGWPVDAVVISVIVVLNGILGYVQEAKAADAAAAGVDGLIVVDCPPEESDPLADALDANGVALIRPDGAGDPFDGGQ